MIAISAACEEGVAEGLDGRGRLNQCPQDAELFDGHLVAPRSESDASDGPVEIFYTMEFLAIDQEACDLVFANDIELKGSVGVEVFL